MKKHELLKYAYDNYRKGAVCRFKNVNVNHISDGTFKVIESTDNGTCVVNDKDDQCFYADGEWAAIKGYSYEEIIEQPKEITGYKLSNGKTANINNKVIALFDGNDWINITPSDVEDLHHALKKLKGQVWI